MCPSCEDSVSRWRKRELGLCAAGKVDPCWTASGSRFSSEHPGSPRSSGHGRERRASTLCRHPWRTVRARASGRSRRKHCVGSRLALRQMTPPSRTTEGQRSSTLIPPRHPADYSPETAEPQMMALRRADICVTCGASLDPGTRAEWDPRARTVTCVECVVIEALRCLRSGRMCRFTEAWCWSVVLQALRLAASTTSSATNGTRMQGESSVVASAASTGRMEPGESRRP